MGLGPVFRVEVVKASRRRRTYLIRAMAGAAMLLVLSEGYEWFEMVREMPSGPGSWNDARHLPALAMAFFARLVLFLLVLIPLVVPGMVAGAIAEEDRRRTMLDLLTTRLTSAEIALGKLAAKLVQVAAMVAIILPVAAVAGAYDGLDVFAVGAAIGLVAMLTLAVGSASLFLSALFRRPRGAIVSAYLLMAAWLIGIPMAAEISANTEGPIASLIRGPLRLLTMSNPYFAGSYLNMLVNSRFFDDPATRAMQVWWVSKELVMLLAWAMGSQAIASVLFLIGAVALLRPVRVGVKWWPRWHRRRPRRAVGRVGPDPPPMGDDPIGWKERYVPEGSSALSARWGIAAMLALSIAAFADPARLALVEWFEGGSRMHRDELHGWLRDSILALGLLWIMVVAAVGSGSIAGERERRTWESLTATPLTGRQIVRGKVVGTLWTTRGLAAPIAALWVLGLIGGAVHPLGVLASALVLGTLLPLAASIGVGCSMVAPTSNRALWTALTVLLGGQLFIVLYVALQIAGAELDSITLAGVGPAMLWASLLSEHDAAMLWRSFSAIGTPEGAPAIYVAAFAVLAVVDLLAARAINWWAARRYDLGPDRSKPRGRPIDRPGAPPGDRERLRTCVRPLSE